MDLTETVLRAALAGDGEGYLAGLGALQPGIGAKGKWQLTAFLSKAACYINMLNNPEQMEDMAEPLRHSAQARHPTTLNWGPEFAGRFSRDESAALWGRFAPLDAALQREEHYVASFQGGPVPYEFNTMPTDLDLVALGGGGDAAA